MRELLQSKEALQAALEKNPNLITEKDDEGKTLLHHAAKIGLEKNFQTAKGILEKLFEMPELDFNLKDNKGNTPMHVAALCCVDKECKRLFYIYLQEATRRNFDFSILGHDRKTILQLTMLQVYNDKDLGKMPQAYQLLNGNNNVTDPGLNVLSASGATAFFYAVRSNFIDEMKRLLDAGADPTLFGSKKRDPLLIIDRHLKKNGDDLAQAKNIYRRQSISSRINGLNELKKRLLLHPSVKSYAEIRKNARIIDQGSRSSNPQCLLYNMPSELLIKIVGFTGNPSTHNRKSAEHIAREYFDRPTISS